MKTSETAKEIYTALSNFQGNISNPFRSEKNPFFKSTYVPLQALIEHIKEPLKANGLCFVQDTLNTADGVGVVTRLGHTSGEWIEGSQIILPLTKKDPQGAGMAITYARRYSLSAILGLEGDKDDDGNYSSGNEYKPSKSTQKTNEPVKYPCEDCGETIDGVKKFDGSYMKDVDVVLATKKKYGIALCLNCSKKRRENA